MSTYTLISSQVLGSTTANVTFSSIPQTYTDLVLRISSRETPASATTTYYLKVNSLTSGYSDTRLAGNGSAAQNSRNTGGGSWEIATDSAANATANTFGSTEIYFPNYAGSTYKVVSSYSAAETNASAPGSYVNMVDASLLSNTAAITSITVMGASFVSGSSFYLYGI
jgi:hypothetical protein